MTLAQQILKDALHHGEGKSGLVKAILLVLFSGFAGFVKFPVVLDGQQIDGIPPPQDCPVAMHALSA